MFESIPYFRVEFEVDDGSALAIVGHYDNGRQDKKRTD